MFLYELMDVPNTWIFRRKVNVGTGLAFAHSCPSSRLPGEIFCLRHCMYMYMCITCRQICPTCFDVTRRCTLTSRESNTLLCLRLSLTQLSSTYGTIYFCQFAWLTLDNTYLDIPCTTGVVDHMIMGTLFPSFACYLWKGSLPEGFR